MVRRDENDPYRGAMSARFILVASLWVAPGKVAEFEAWERAAARVMARHGGRIERAIRCRSGVPDAAEPFEIHIVSFPDEAAWERYRADPELAGLAAARAECITRTTILAGKEIAPYDEHGAHASGFGRDRVGDAT